MMERGSAQLSSVCREHKGPGKYLHEQVQKRGWGIQMHTLWLLFSSLRLFYAFPYIVLKFFILMRANLLNIPFMVTIFNGPRNLCVLTRS